MRGYLRYYSFVHNYSDLVSMIYYTLYGSCAKLLAAKFSLRSIGRVRAKFGKQLSSKEISLYKPKYAATHTFNTSANPNIRLLFANISTATLNNLVCSACGSTYRVEMHHVRKLADIKKSKSFVDRLMISRRRRKQVPLCRVCHMKHHHSDSK